MNCGQQKCRYYHCDMFAPHWIWSNRGPKIRSSVLSILSRGQAEGCPLANNKHSRSFVFSFFKRTLWTQKGFVQVLSLPWPDRQSELGIHIYITKHGWSILWDIWSNEILLILIYVHYKSFLCLLTWHAHRGPDWLHRQKTGIALRILQETKCNLWYTVQFEITCEPQKDQKYFAILLRDSAPIHLEDRWS